MSDESTKTSVSPGVPVVSADGSTRMERYHAWRDRRIATSALRRRVWRVLVAVVGTAIVLGGLALVPLPGPGWLVVIIGLAVLASEFEWAQHALDFVTSTLDAWVAWLGRQSLWMRALVGLVGLVFVYAVLVLSVRLLGTPGWVPDWVPFLD